MNDMLSIRRAAGGSVIDYPPLYSADEEILFIIRDKIVRAYSTITGEWIRDLEGANANIVNIENNPYNPMLLNGCTVNGEIISWKYKSGTIDNVSKIKFPTISVVVKTFHIIPVNKDNCALITWKVDNGHVVQIGIFDLITGNQKQFNVPITLDSGDFKLAVSKNNFCTIAIIQNFKLFVANYKTGFNRFYVNDKKQKLTAVACHPVEELVATGDAVGKIFLYRQIYRNGMPTNLLCHWHHGPVQTIAFTASGSTFYSGGDERVLVKWNTNQSDERSFLPRMMGTLIHVVVGCGNQKIAVSTDDNGIQILNPQFVPLSIVQNFTWVADDKTSWPKFPIGLKLNPRTSSLVLNGRTGQLQFYSTHTRCVSNLDTTLENRSSIERDKLLYNTRITNAACNMDWLVTAEELNDIEHFPEVRLRFWKFDTVKQSYTLNTQIELPHEGGVSALEFSSSFRVDNLLCASSGKDGNLKVWGLEETASIHKTGKYWVCLETTSYKNLAVKSLSFSSDGSLLSVGYGNTLCVYVPETLRIKCELSTPCGHDGSVNQLIINIPTTTTDSKTPSKKEQTQRVQLNEKRKQIQQLVTAFLENFDDKLLTNIINNSERLSRISPNGNTNESTVRELTTKQQEMIFKAIVAQNELNFFQKLKVFQKIGLHIQLTADCQAKFKDYINKNVSIVERKEQSLIKRVLNLSESTKFIAQRQLTNYMRRKSSDALKGLNLKNVNFEDDKKANMRKNRTRSETKLSQPMDLEEENSDETIYSMKNMSQINHVLFATREFSHFVIVCTEKRLLIWNLLTVRLHAALKLSVNHIVVDPYTSLVAAFTIFNELYVFLPNSPYPLYQRKNMPKIHGAAWIPRRYPKQQSLNVDWQATSQLYFLSDDQSLLYLVSENDDELIASQPALFKEAIQLNPQTPFGAMIAKNIVNATTSIHGQRTHTGALIGDPTKSSVKTLTNLQTHTMAPVSYLSYDFLASLVTPDNNKSQKKQKKKGFQQLEEEVPIEIDSDDEKNRETDEKIASRLAWLHQEASVTKLSEKLFEQENQILKTLKNEKLRFSMDI